MAGLWSHRRHSFVGSMLGAVVLMVLGACSSSGSKSTTSSSTTASGGASTTAAPGSSTSPGTSFTAATVAGLGSVVVDAQGHTVYVLTADDKHNLPCTDASGCTKVWPDLPLPDGVSAATAGSGLQASLLGAMKESDGQTYATYGGWLMYEYTGDTASGQGHGEGIKSFGGTWYALSPTGHIVETSSS